jgi:acetyl-CoA carboxylase carboxyltransferase component
VSAAFKRNIETSDDPEATLAATHDEYRAMNSPVRSARIFNFDELIDPRETRPRIVRALRRARHRQEQTTGPWQHFGLFP